MGRRIIEPPCVAARAHADNSMPQIVLGAYQVMYLETNSRGQNYGGRDVVRVGGAVGVACICQTLVY